MDNTVMVRSVENKPSIRTTRLKGPTVHCRSFLLSH
nr:MAG TPA: hypothetical protein [Caudoviricetes sp.]